METLGWNLTRSNDSASLNATKTCKVTKIQPENDQCVNETNKIVQKQTQTEDWFIYLAQ